MPADGASARVFGPPLQRPGPYYRTGQAPSDLLAIADGVIELERANTSVPRRRERNLAQGPRTPRRPAFIGSTSDAPARYRALIDSQRQPRPGFIPLTIPSFTRLVSKAARGCRIDSLCRPSKRGMYCRRRDYHYQSPSCCTRPWRSSFPTKHIRSRSQAQSR